MQRQIISLLFLTIGWMGIPAIALGHESGGEHPHVQWGPIGQTGPADLPLWADILIGFGLISIVVVGTITLLWLKSETYRKGVSE